MRCNVSFIDKRAVTTQTTSTVNSIKTVQPTTQLKSSAAKPTPAPSDQPKPSTDAEGQLTTEKVLPTEESSQTTSFPDVARQESSSTLSTSERIGIGLGVIVFLVIALVLLCCLCRKKKDSGGAYHIYLDKGGEGKILTMNDYNDNDSVEPSGETTYKFVKGEEKVMDDKHLLL